MRMSDWSADVCSSALRADRETAAAGRQLAAARYRVVRRLFLGVAVVVRHARPDAGAVGTERQKIAGSDRVAAEAELDALIIAAIAGIDIGIAGIEIARFDEQWERREAITGEHLAAKRTVDIVIAGTVRIERRSTDIRTFRVRRQRQQRDRKSTRPNSSH